MAKDRLEAFDDIPFIRDYDITFEEGKMNIQVYEKALVASFYYMGQYVFFDKDGVILETASNSVAEIPCIEGVDFLNFSMNSKIQLKNDEQIKMILDIAELIKHYSLNAQTVKFDNNLEVTLCCDGVNVLLGKKEMYDQQIASVSEVLEQIKGKDIKLIAIVHYDKNYENAAFYLPYDSSTTGYFYFGDGNVSKGTGSFVNGLDVVGHEYQHCITDSIVELEYFNESGAICEAYSDIFGACIEGNELTDTNFWRMGENIYINNDYFRDMSNPAANGKGGTISYENLYPLCTNSSCSHSNCDNGGVHYNSTLMCYATYIMYQQDTDFFTKSNILKLWYQTLGKLTVDATFIEFADLMLQSAKELNFPEENILDIEFAFASIDMPGYTGIKIWNDYTLQYLQGSGTLVDPYLINSTADLASLAYYINVAKDSSYANARYKVNADLNLNNIKWVGIGTSENPFNGVFNGGGKTITGLNLNANTGDLYSGLFNYAGQNSYIYDIRIAEGMTTSRARYTGAIAGLLQGTISGCSSALNIIGTNIGGLVGLVINNTGGERIVNSYSTADLDGKIVGGLVSEFSTSVNSSTNLYISGYISSSYTTGTLTGNVVGGIVGRANALYLANVITTVTIQDVLNESTLGGVVGELGFAEINSNSNTNVYNVENMILSAKVAVLINSQKNDTKKGLLIGNFVGKSTEGTLYIDNTSVKKQDNLTYCSTNLSGDNIKIIDTKIVTDDIYEGVFDFDNKYYYQRVSNWTILNGIEAFDFVSTFNVIEENTMPIFTESDFWINHSTNSFSSGDGSESNPFVIKTPEQLALLARLVADPYYNAYYSLRHYKLGTDIDLSGKIWVGIGVTYITVENGVTTGYDVYPFSGTFDGNGYSIINMTSIGAYSVQGLNSTGSNYMLTEYLPALFGNTQIKTDGTNIFIPTIKNLTIENINTRGSYASSIVSKVYLSAKIDNVSVRGGNITSDFISGGLIGIIDGLNNCKYDEGFVTEIKDSSTDVNVSGRIAGGVVGYANNAESDVSATLNVINYVNKGKISATGEDYDSVYSNGSSSYYRPIAGSIVGVSLIKNLNIINCINLGDVVSYNLGGYIGGFIGALGVGGAFTPDTMNIIIDGSKQIGKIYYIFDDLISSAGSIIGGTHSQLNSVVNIEILETTYTNQDDPLVKNNEMGAKIIVVSNMVVSDDNIGEGVFDIYNEEYYSNSNYFNAEYVWGESQIKGVKDIIVFRDHDGTYLGEYVLGLGETSILEKYTPHPTKMSNTQYQYGFTGWSQTLENITQSMTVFAEYSIKTMQYEVNYYDEDGNLLSTVILDFGESVNQEIEAPEKKSGFLFEYEFIRWGEEGQTVTGDMNIKPVYRMSLTTAGKAILISVALLIGFLFYYGYNKKKKQA